MSDSNIWSEEWGERGEDWSGAGGRGKRLPHSDRLGATVYVMASTLSSPEVCEYPDLRQITAQTSTGSMTGERLWLIHDVDPEPEVET